MNLNKDPESWARVKPDAFLSGSIVQVRNVLEMALQDIARMAIEIRRLNMEVVGSKPLYSRRKLEEENAELRAQVESAPKWEDIDGAPIGERIMLMWDDSDTLSAHVELGKVQASGHYVNTYGKLFIGRPTHFMRLPSRSHPSTDQGGGEQ